LIQYIYGYVAKSLAGIGDLNTELQLGGENTTMDKIDEAFKEVDGISERVPVEAREWRGKIAIREGKEPVIVLGNIYEEGQQRPGIPDALERLFPGQTPVNLPLSYQG
jgi:hypothetical protein